MAHLPCAAGGSLPNRADFWDTTSGMDLVDQLRGWQEHGKPRRRRAVRGEGPPPPADAPDPRTLAARLEGAEVVEEAGARLVLRRVEREFKPSTRAVAPLLRRVLGDDFAASDMLILDAETTGLAGGTGTVAFLVGLAHWEGKRLIIEQAFMPDHADEPALLAWLQRRLDAFRALASHSGKTFDLPLLRTRWRLAGEHGKTDRPHFDLLHVARRLFAHRLRSCGMATVHERILGFQRGDDLPKKSPPRAYFRYLGDHEIDTMASVFQCNESDLIATASLLARVADFYAQPAKRGFGDAGDWLGLADWAEQLGDLEHAHAVLTLALGALRDTPRRTRIEMHLADLARRLGRGDEALALWQSVAERDPLAGWPAVREIAQWHERREEWSEAHGLLAATAQRFAQAHEMRSRLGESRLPAAWRQWMGECEQLRDALRQAAGEEQMTLAL